MRKGQCALLYLCRPLGGNDEPGRREVTRRGCFNVNFDASVARIVRAKSLFPTAGGRHGHSSVGCVQRAFEAGDQVDRGGGVFDGELFVAFEVHESPMGSRKQAALVRRSVMRAVFGFGEIAHVADSAGNHHIAAQFLGIALAYENPAIAHLWPTDSSLNDSARRSVVVTDRVAGMQPIGARRKMKRVHLYFF